MVRSRKNKSKGLNKLPHDDETEEAQEQTQPNGGENGEKTPMLKEWKGAGDVNAENNDKNPDQKDADNKESLNTGEAEVPDSTVDQFFGVIQQASGIWVLVVGVGALLAVLAHVEVADDSEQLIVEKGVALSRSRARIFQYVSDLSHYSQWYPAIRSFDPTDETPVGIGKHFTEVIHVPIYGEVRYDNVITGYESPRYISFLCDSWLQLRIEIELNRRDSNTTPTALTYRVYANTKTYLMRYLVLPVVKIMYGNRARQAMLNLRFAFSK